VSKNSLKYTYNIHLLVLQEIARGKGGKRREKKRYKVVGQLVARHVYEKTDKEDSAKCLN